MFFLLHTTDMSGSADPCSCCRINEGLDSTSGSLMVWLLCSGVVCGSVHVYWRSSALLQEPVFKPERKRADLSSLSSMSTDTSTAPLGDNS